MLAPMQAEFKRVFADKAYLEDCLKKGAEKAFKHAVKSGVGRMCVSYQMDREHASFDMVTQQLRDRLKRGDYAACLDLAPEHAPDDEQALALAMAAVQCAQRALEAERFDTARHLAQQGLSWNAGSV